MQGDGAYFNDELYDAGQAFADGFQEGYDSIFSTFDDCLRADDEFNDTIRGVLDEMEQKLEEEAKAQQKRKRSSSRRRKA